MLDASLIFEAVTALATLAVPVVVGVMANRFNHRLKRWEASQWRNQELVKARLCYYQELVPQLNDLMCYFTSIGNWKAFTPRQVVDSKRTLDRAFFCAAPLFSDGVHKAYGHFIENCFEMWGGFGHDARLKTNLEYRKSLVENWNPDWDKLFVATRSSRLPAESEIRATYQALVDAFVRDIDLTASDQ